MFGGQGVSVVSPVADGGEPPTRDPLAQDVYDAVRGACLGGLSGGQIIAAVQQAIAASRELEPAGSVAA
ncbi:hypothetical protein AB0B88_15965 [Micromonospora haikouensis]|uniref:hypothetical protein n=1 Tax=Micromonospora haikouensis TaxID=686309 RepID=UPI0033D3EE22